MPSLILIKVEPVIKYLCVSPLLHYINLPIKPLTLRLVSTIEGNTQITVTMTNYLAK